MLVGLMFVDLVFTTRGDDVQCAQLLSTVDNFRHLLITFRVQLYVQHDGQFGVRQHIAWVCLHQLKPVNWLCECV